MIMKEKVRHLRDVMKPHIQEFLLASILLMGIIAGIWIVCRF